MMEMSWIRSSRTAVLGVLLAIALVTAGTAAAVSFTGEAPESTEVGETVSMNVTMSDAFEEPLPNSWTLQANTDLVEADWTIRATDVAGDTVAQRDVVNQSVQLDLDSADGVNEVVIIVEGEVPPMNSPDDFSYEDLEVENYTAIELSRVVEAGVSTLDGGTFTAHRYTEQSREARNAIDEASETVEEAGSGESELQQAIDVYNNGNFGTAIELADEAESAAESDQQTSQLLLIGGAIVVLLVVVGGGAFYWKRRQKNTNKLR